MASAFASANQLFPSNAAEEGTAPVRTAAAAASLTNARRDLAMPFSVPTFGLSGIFSSIAERLRLKEPLLRSSKEPAIDEFLKGCLLIILAPLLVSSFVPSPPAK